MLEKNAKSVREKKEESSGTEKKKKTAQKKEGCVSLTQRTKREGYTGIGKGAGGSTYKKKPKKKVPRKSGLAKKGNFPGGGGEWADTPGKSEVKLSTLEPKTKGSTTSRQVLQNQKVGVLGGSRVANIWQTSTPEGFPDSLLPKEPRRPMGGIKALGSLRR